MKNRSTACGRSDRARECRLAEERFLLAAQRAMQRLLNEKGIRYKDLARRLDVSEARVSHIFGDDATNLTIRTVARVFHCLGEQPLVMSITDYQRQLAEAAGRALPPGAGWSMSGVPADFSIEPTAEAVDDLSLPKDTARPASPRDWALAEAAAERRGRAA
jgi:plasmid maintenance system antidote protein VapI